MQGFRLNFAPASFNAHLPPFLSAVSTSQNLVNNWCIEPSPCHAVFFLCGSLLHSDVRHSLEEKICLYFCFNCDCKLASCHRRSAAVEDVWIAISPAYILIVYSVCLGGEMIPCVFEEKHMQLVLRGPWSDVLQIETTLGRSLNGFLVLLDESGIWKNCGKLWSYNRFLFAMFLPSCWSNIQSESLVLLGFITDSTISRTEVFERAMH